MIAALSGWSQNSITQGGSKAYTIQMNVGEATGATYAWAVIPANGTSTDLSAITGNTATIVWDGPVGDYIVSVQTTDGNGCLSGAIIQDMEILDPGDIVFAAALPSTTTCSDLAAGNPSSQSQFRITYDGAANLTSANVTVKNPDGDYTDLDGNVLADQLNPELSINNDAADKEIDFAVTDNWENASSANVEFEVMLLSALTADDLVVNADPTGDVERTITVLAKPVIAFE